MILRNQERIFIDGTFKIVPEQFCQLYTVHGKFMNQLFPFIFALLPSKSQYIYEQFWKNLKQASHALNISLDIKEIFSDFEASAINAVSTIFPTSIVKGCYFHFTQSIWRKVNAQYIFNVLFLLTLLHLTPCIFCVKFIYLVV